jgi:hypothetical protein
MKRIFTILGLSFSLALPVTLAAQVASAPSPQNPNGSSSLLAQNPTLAWSSSAMQDQTGPPPPPPQEQTPPPPPPSQPIGNPPSAYNYDHGEVGAYADYFRFKPSGTAVNFLGVGGRVAFNVHPNVALEAEMNYDFAQDYTSSSSSGNAVGASTVLTTTSLRPLTGLFGPKFQFGTSSAFRAFLTGKVGFINFTTTNANNVSGSGASSAVSSVGGPGTFLALYPGGGIEGFWGPFGLRLDAGDEIYLNNGTWNNLRVAFGPTFRF